MSLVKLCVYKEHEYQQLKYYVRTEMTFLLDLLDVHIYIA